MSHHAKLKINLASDLGKLKLLRMENGSVLETQKMVRGPVVVVFLP